jgi:hypothetical protein
MSRIVTNITSAAGCTGCISPETSQYFRLVRAPIGRKPSTPGGRETSGTTAPRSTELTNMPKRMPIPITHNIKHHCTTVRMVLADFVEIPFRYMIILFVSWAFAEILFSILFISA